MAAAATKYEDFEPTSETVQEKDCETILLYVPGFKKGQLRVQFTSTNLVRISGEKEMEAGKSLRFAKEFPVRPNIDTTQISAKFEKGILYVKLPKLNDEQEQSTKPAADSADIPAQKSEQVPKRDNNSNDISNDDAKHPIGRNANENTTTAMTSSEICYKLSRRALYAVLVGLAAVGVTVSAYISLTSISSEIPQCDAVD